ncbi:hypothetical protein GCM10028857_15810 [Salinarchaeum chitinilyticum]
MEYKVVERSENGASIATFRTNVKLARLTGVPISQVLHPDRPDSALARGRICQVRLRCSVPEQFEH